MANQVRLISRQGTRVVVDGALAEKLRASGYKDVRPPKPAKPAEKPE